MTDNTAAPIAAASTTGLCAYCSTPLEAGGRGRGRVFCAATTVKANGKRDDSPCRLAFAKRAKSEGAAILAYVLASIETRHAKPGTREAEICRQARSEMTAIGRDILNRRKADGMPPAADYVETLLATGERYMDRTRR